MSQEVTVTPIQQVTREPRWVRWLLIAIGLSESTLYPALIASRI